MEKHFKSHIEVLDRNHASMIEDLLRCITAASFLLLFNSFACALVFFFLSMYYCPALSYLLSSISPIPLEKLPVCVAQADLTQ